MSDAGDTVTAPGSGDAMVTVTFAAGCAASRTVKPPVIPSVIGRVGADVTIACGSSSVTVTVTVRGDSEPLETVTVTLSLVGSASSTPATVTVWAVLQLAVVNDSVAGDTVAAP